MIVDYYTQVKAEIAERRDAEIKTLLATSGSANHDVIRGTIAGLDRAVAILDEVLAQFSSPEDEAPTSISITSGTKPSKFKITPHYRGRA